MPDKDGYRPEAEQIPVYQSEADCAVQRKLRDELVTQLKTKFGERFPNALAAMAGMLLRQCLDDAAEQPKMLQRLNLELMLHSRAKKYPRLQLK